jgi:RNA polymerase subunit RPABC4/transcription elongation factor Spt4
MLRLLGFLALVVICIETAPWGLVVGCFLLVGWFLTKPAAPPEKLGIVSVGSRLLRAIPLVNAVYCADCDSITESPHDACGVCGSHSVVSVSRMLQRSWQPTAVQLDSKRAKYKLSLTAEVREIPADGLGDISDLITRLAESGGRVERLHINAEPTSSILDPCATAVVPLKRTVTSACREVRQAS